MDGWNTIESDAVSSKCVHSACVSSERLLTSLQGVFTYLVENLGVENVQFEEMVSLDATYLQQFWFALP